MSDNQAPVTPQELLEAQGYYDLEVTSTASSKAVDKTTADQTAEVMHILTGLPYTVKANPYSGYGVYVLIEKDNLYPAQGLTLDTLIEQLKHQARGVKAGIRYHASRPTAQLRGLVEGASASMGLSKIDIVTTDDGPIAHDLAARIATEYGISAEVLSLDAYNFTVSIIKAEGISFAGHALLRTYAQGYLDGHIDGHASAGDEYDEPDTDDDGLEMTTTYPALSRVDPDDDDTGGY